MAFTQSASLKGSSKEFRLNPAAKRYTLRDHGFQETKSGNFLYTRSLNTDKTNKAGALLKITVAGDFSGIKVSTTTANGLKMLDIYGNPNMTQLVEHYEYLLTHFVTENLFEEV